MMKELDVVRLESSEALDGVPAGSIGTIHIIHTYDPPTFEVEFENDAREVLGIYTVNGRDLSLVWRHDEANRPDDEEGDQRLGQIKSS